MASIWDEKPELVEELKTLWAEGLSASQCARALGNGITRNSAIGKATRLKLLDHGNRGQRGRIMALRPLTGDSPSKSKARKAPMHPDEGRKLEPVVDEEVGIVTPINAKDKHCRYPYGDVGQQNFQYCGRMVEHGSFCPGHRAVCFDKPQQREATA